MKAKENQSTFLSRVSNFWSQDSPLLILLKFGLFMAVFYLFFSTDFYKAYVFQPVVEANAWIGSLILSLLGMGTVCNGMSISSPDFSISIGVGCDGIEPIALYLAAVFIYPLSWKSRGQGMLFGGLFLLAINQFRIVSLFLTGVYVPSIFDLMHLDVWQVLFIAFAVFTWLFWVQWASKKEFSSSTENEAS